MEEKFVYFFGPENPFSQWHVLGEYPSSKTQFRAKCRYSDSTHNFVNCEQWMMFNKAKLFGDDAIAEKILAENNPKTIKSLGRKVANFNDSTWNNHRVEIIYEGNKHKFTQNPALFETLLATHGTTLVEASPFDKIWGIGLRATDPKAATRATWKGLNLLGEALTRLRNDLMNDHFPLPVTLAVTQQSPNFKHSQFQGCILGVLIGDAIGLPFELQTHVTPANVQKYFDYLNDTGDISPKFYSDDTAMTISVAKSIVACKSLSVLDLAKRFTIEFLKDDRHYGGTVRNVFLKLREMNFSDPFLPAKIQQNGKGSWGNGAAMRVAPIPLMLDGTQKSTEMLDIVVESSRITHTHPLGIAGAIFQALAIKNALVFGEASNKLQPNTNSQQTTPNQILSAVESEWEAIKTGDLIGSETAQYVQSGLDEYSKKLKVINDFLQNTKQNPTIQEIAIKLGNKISAIDSVTTAFYCFLASFENHPQIKADNQFQKSIQMAISLGGDTDTIASMTGAICGAFLGRQLIPVSLLRHCHGVVDLSDLAQQLYDCNSNKLKAGNPLKPM